MNKIIEAINTGRTNHSHDAACQIRSILNKLNKEEEFYCLAQTVADTFRKDEMTLGMVGFQVFYSSLIYERIAHGIAKEKQNGIRSLSLDPRQIRKSNPSSN